MKYFLSLLLISGIAYAQPTPKDLFEKFGAKVMEKNPNISEFEVCIESSCDTFFPSDIPRRVNPGAAADPSTAGTSVADAVGDIIGHASKAVGVGGRVVVDYEKKADGSIKVRVEASFGTGAGAAAGASSSNPDNGQSK
jgi:hypothetical protein